MKLETSREKERQRQEKIQQDPTLLHLKPEGQAWLDFLQAPPVVYPVAGQKCVSEVEGKVRGVLIGINNYSGPLKLQGPVNDVRFLEKAFRHRYPDASLKTLLDEQATKEGITTALRKLTEEVRCGDFVVFHFSGAEFLASVLADTFKNGLGEPFAIPDKVLGQGSLLAQNGYLAGNKLSPEGVLRGVDIANWIRIIRNRGAFVLAIIDTCHAESLQLMELQNRMDWSLRLKGPDLLTKSLESAKTARLQPGAAGLSVFYASDKSATTLDVNSKALGPFSYAIGSALQLSDAGSTVRSVAEAAARILKEEDNARLLGYPAASRNGLEWLNSSAVFQSSDPDQLILTPRKISETLKAQVIYPPMTRGSLRLAQPKFTLRGKLEHPEKIAKLMINLEHTDFDPDTGEFHFEAALSPGQNELVALATPYDSPPERLTIPVVIEGHLDKILGVGHKYALIIANSDYPPKSGFPPLRTPAGDARDLVALLTSTYGFATTIKSEDGTPKDLVLYNATADNITDTLSLLANTLKPDDSLLIFYAGHGKFDDMNQKAYWVPVDAIKGRYRSFIGGDELATEYLSRIQARQILILSDSCHSGALTRGGEEPVARKGEERDRYIEKLVSKKTRILISSGGNEEVADNNGKGHSPFAQALLEGLRDNAEPLLTGAELFLGSIKGKVAGARDSIQTPDMQQIRGSGNDGGGDFIFKRVGGKSGAGI